MPLKSYLSVALLLIIILSSCEKAEKPVVLPPPSGSQSATVDMGIDYEHQIFYSFETGIVKTSEVESWDLAFEASAEGYHLFLNGGKNIQVYHTHVTDPQLVNNPYYYKSLSKDSLSFDAPCGLPDSTGIGEWKDYSGASQKEVLVININNQTFKKIVINSVSAENYSICYADVTDNVMKEIIIPKDALCNYSYFSFDNNGAVVYPEPAKNSWDIVFTRYMHYFWAEKLTYLVSGALLNPYQTTALADSTTGYSDINFDAIQERPFSNFRNVIGYDWKTPKIDMAQGTAVYTVNPMKCYVVKTQTSGYWKLHFLNFYDNNGEKGHPYFEFKKIR